jgi:hypothetical protein
MERTSISCSSSTNETGLSFALELSKHRTAVRFQDFSRVSDMLCRDFRYGLCSTIKNVISLNDLHLIKCLLIALVNQVHRVATPYKAYRLNGHYQIAILIQDLYKCANETLVRF